MQYMNAKMQYKLSAADLEVLLALVRAGTLAAAGERLGVDGSTVFRALQRIERGIGYHLFERSRSGYLPFELALELVAHAEQIEVELEAARSAAQLLPEDVSGSVRITTTDTILHGLVAPALKDLHQLHPALHFELQTGNELANLSRRDADIAIRATKKPPEHLVGRHIGPIRTALFSSQLGQARSMADVEAGNIPWIAPDDALPEHPSVLWRKRRFPKITATYRVDSILSVLEFVALGMGVGVLPLFLVKERPELIQLSGALDESQTELWLLTHPESRHLRRVSTVFKHLSQHMVLP